MDGDRMDSANECSVAGAWDHNNNNNKKKGGKVACEGGWRQG